MDYEQSDYEQAFLAFLQSIPYSTNVVIPQAPSLDRAWTQQPARRRSAQLEEPITQETTVTDHTLAWDSMMGLFEMQTAAQRNPAPRYIHGAPVPHLFPVWHPETQAVLGHVKLEEAIRDAYKYTPVIELDAEGRDVVQGFISRSDKTPKAAKTLGEKFTELQQTVVKLEQEFQYAQRRLASSIDTHYRDRQVIQQLSEQFITLREVHKMQQQLIDSLTNQNQKQQAELNELRQQVLELKHNRYAGSGELPVSATMASPATRKVRKLLRRED